jgi:hypothetical protein
MKIAAPLAILITTAATIACSTTPIQTTDQWGNSKYRLAQEDPATAQRHDAASAHIARVAALSNLSGRFQGTGPENELTLVLERIRDPRVESRISLSLTVSGRYRGKEVREVGLVRLGKLSTTPTVSYFPDFDPEATPLSRAAIRFGDAGPRAACGFSLQPKGDGFSGETSCERAFSGAPGKWSIEIQSGDIQLTNLESGETLRFAKTS